MDLDADRHASSKGSKDTISAQHRLNDYMTASYRMFTMFRNALHAAELLHVSTWIRPSITWVTWQAVRRQLTEVP